MTTGHDFPPPPWPDRIQCRRCGLLVAPNVVGFNPDNAHPPCGLALTDACADHGECPGRELKAIFAALGVKPTAGCNCEGVARWMDQIGPAECEQRRAEIVAMVQRNYDAMDHKPDGWFVKLRALVTGIAFKIDPADRIGSLVDLAIARAK